MGKTIWNKKVFFLLEELSSLILIYRILELFGLELELERVFDVFRITKFWKLILKILQLNNIQKI